MTRTGGIVLCGGQSRRMGRPKAWLPFAGEVMLPRVVRLLGEAVAPVVVVAAPGQDVPPLPAGVEVVRDEEEGRGPLQGLAAGLAALTVGPRPPTCRRATCRSCARPSCADWSSCWATGHLRAARRRVSPSPGGRVPAGGGRGGPRLLAEDRLRPFFLFEAVPTRVVGAEELADVDPHFQTLRNLNTPEEYEVALGEI